MLATVFIETTIPSYYVARRARNLFQLARQERTPDWWDWHRTEYDLHTTQLVLDEAAEGDAEMAAARLALLSGIPLLDLGDDVTDLANELLAKEIVPARASRDAVHIAAAGIQEMDFLLTWNCRHIANAHIQERLRACFSGHGIDLPVICTPEELLADENEPFEI